MTIKRRGLGRNLESLLSVHPTAVLTPPEVVADGRSQLHLLPVTSLESGRFQPRKEMDPNALEELASSIKTQGVLQPIVVRAVSTGRYEIIAGERRWRAAQIAGLTEIPVLIKEVSDRIAMALALIENMQREDLNPMEEASAIHRLVEECELTHHEVAETLSKSRASVTNLLRLMNLNSEVKTLLSTGDIEFGHAKVLLALSGKQQTQAAQIVVEKNLSVRETETLVKKFQNGVVKKAVKTTDPDIRHLVQSLSEKLGAKIEMKHSPRGKGKLLIYYNSLDELDGILAHME
ncbi:MAG: ParB/RepB/Spo0J family partition protein [Legionellales bacterium]|nr:ParB/RepB/Spo0J family partition protein [Legionellales bacterium]